MCGLLTFIGQATAERHAEIASTLDALEHRGPDEGGLVTVDEHAVCGFRRLSIIDIEHGHQPLWYADDRYVLTFNGEIYNYVELRAELARDFDASFATQGDAEVIAAAYHYWGAAGVHRLRGMFAFVLWDRVDKVAFGARDPFGIKPLYCAVTAEGTYFASEKKALVPFLPKADQGAQGIDRTGLAHYLTFQYVPEPGSLHQGITRIGAGESFTCPVDGPLERHRYTRPDLRPGARYAPERDLPRIRDALRDSIRLHMRSDVPVGAFLSSGIDSTAVVALAREVNPDILTFTAALEVPGYSELDVAAETARQLEVVNHPVVVSPQMMMDALPRIVWHLDDPVADPALVPLYYVAKKAREHVTVSLSGEGADELFGGYPIYREPGSLRAITRLPSPVQGALRRLAAVLPEGVKGKSFLERGTTSLSERFCGNARIFAEDEKQRVLRDAAAPPYTDVTDPVYQAVRGMDDVTAMQEIDLRLWLVGDILVKADRMSMANSLEVRVPFLDSAVLEAARYLPTEAKVPQRPPGATKHALRQAMRGIVPDSVVDRVKLGFPTPIRVWLTGEMYEWARQILSTSTAGALVDLRYGLDLLESHRRGEADHSRKIWAILVFCVWYAIVIDGSWQPMHSTEEPIRAVLA